MMTALGAAKQGDAAFANREIGSLHVFGATGCTKADDS